MNLKSHEERVDMLKKSVLVPYDTDGQYNAGMFRFLRSVAHAFCVDKSYHDFIGVIPLGSQIKGYAKTGESDFDLIFLGAPETTAGAPFIDTTSKIAREATRHNNSCSIGHYPFTKNRMTAQLDNVAWPLSMLVRPIIGNLESVTSLRKKLRDIVHKKTAIDPTGLQRDIRQAMHIILDDDFCGTVDNEKIVWTAEDYFQREEINFDALRKMINRGFTRTEINDIFDARRAMWHSRIRDFVNASGPFSNLN